MTDEEYGRAWAAMMGKQPHQDVPDGNWYWLAALTRFDEDPYCRLAEFLYLLSWRPDEFGGKAYYFPKESDAYAALGRAVREVHRLVPPVPD